MTIYALDPGPTRSHLVELHDNGHPIEARSLENPLMLRLCTMMRPRSILVIEQVAGMGMPVGAEVFETVFWSGRFAQAWEANGGAWTRLPRRSVKLALCGSARANDATIRMALLDRYGPGKPAAVGTKANPGPLYGIKADLWQALALGIAYQLTSRLERFIDGEEENREGDRNEGAQNRRPH
jgi:hypothetical protein